MLKKSLRNLIKHKIVDKVVASSLIMTMTLANLIFLGAYLVPKLTSYAAVDDLENQSTSTQSANVLFDAYFMDSSTKVHSIKNDITSAGDTLLINLNVKDAGYLKDGVIQISDANRRNRYKL